MQQTIHKGVNRMKNSKRRTRRVIARVSTPVNSYQLQSLLSHSRMRNAAISRKNKLKGGRIDQDIDMPHVDANGVMHLDFNNSNHLRWLDD